MTSLQRQLTTRTLIATLAISTAAGAGLYAYARAALTNEFDLATSGKARAFAALVEIEPSGALEVEFSAHSLPEYYSKAPERFFELRRGDGSLFVGSPALNGRPLLPPHIPLSRRRGFDMELPNGKPGRAIVVSFEPWPEPEKPGVARVLPADLEDFTLVLARDRRELDRTLTLLLSALLLAGIALAGTTTLAVVLVVRRSLRPVQAVADQAAHIDATSLDKRLPVAGLAAELRPICQCINELIERVEAGFKRERQFAANVAHELRTPIAELRTMAEVTLQRTSRSGAPADRKDLDALDIALQMEAIVTTLLALARCQAGTQFAAPGPVDLGDVVNTSWRKFARGADAQGVRAAIDAPAGTMIVTDRGLFSAMLDNLLSNAIEYTRRGGDMRCEVSRADERVTLTISNTTVALSAEDLAHVCEPFWRKDAARSPSSHSGLGLALVDAYAKLLDIALKLDLSSDNRFSVSLTFPVAPDQSDAPPTMRSRAAADLAVT